MTWSKLYGNARGATSMKAGILGSRDVATTPGSGFIKHCHRAIEARCMLSWLPGFLHDAWMHAFKLLR
jgi:hypothetical protein